MIEIEVRNFQSIEHVSFRVDGFTAVVGKSNIGKSAIVRAVKSALTGAEGVKFVRHGEACARLTKNLKTCACFTSVHIKTEGFDLKWEKGDKINQYTFNGSVKTAVERGTPDFLKSPVLTADFGLVKIGDRSELLQVADQFNPLFLIDQTGGTVADVLSDVARLDRVTIAIRLSEKDRKDAVSTRKVREKDIAELKAKLVAYESFDDTLAKAKAVEEGFASVQTLQTKADQIDGYLKEMGELGLRVDELEKVVAVAVPETVPVSKKHDVLLQLSRFFAQMTEKADAFRALQGVERVEVPAFPGVGEQSDRVIQLARWVSQLRVHKEFFDQTKSVEAATVPEIGGMVEAGRKLAELSRLGSKLVEIQTLLRGYEGNIKDIEDEEKSILGERQQLFAEVKVCPTCDKPFDLGGDHVKDNLVHLSH